MAEPEKKEEEIIEEPVETPAEEPKETPAEEPKEEPKEKPKEEPAEEEEPKLESKTSFLKRLKKSMTLKKTPAEKPSEEEEPEAEEPAKPGDEKYEEISPNFVEAAQKAKWSDEQIVEFAEKYTNEELDKLIGTVLTGVAEEPPEKPAEEKPAEKKEPESQDKLLDELLKDERFAKIVKPLVDKVDTLTTEITTLKKGSDETKADKAVQEYVNMENLANKMFDKNAEEFEEFGKTADMPRFPDGRIVPIGPSYDARSKVWGMAVKLRKAGTTFDEAMGEALQWYKGASTEKKTREKVVKDLKKRETKLTPKRSEKNVQRQYTEGEEDERKADVVKAAYAKTGVKGY